MVDWNKLMKESLTKMMPFSQEKRRKSSFDACKKTTLSEKMQDELEPIPCPMHEDYDDEKINV